mmetsp:Transcript_14167/g.44684  ORF Transcript_14167/g.44684 Transcript_14167/m.44684 type:complete len:198 (-) Transcript_14167:1242-1835(-)
MSTAAWLWFAATALTVDGFGYVEKGLVYDEEAMGDLPEASNSLALGELAAGPTGIRGIVGGDDPEDSFSFVVPDGMVFSSLTLTTYEDPYTGEDGNLGFAHLNRNETSFTPSVETISRMLGGMILTTADIGDLLPSLSNATLDPEALDQDPVPPVGMGFDTPLEPDAYAITVYNGDNGQGDPVDPVLWELVVGLSSA